MRLGLAGSGGASSEKQSPTEMTTGCDPNWRSLASMAKPELPPGLGGGSGIFLCLGISYSFDRPDTAGGMVDYTGEPANIRMCAKVI